MSRRRSLARGAALLVLLGRAASATAADTVPPAAAADAPPGPGPHDPLAGFAGEEAFLRSPGNEVVLMPDLRLQVGGSFLPRSTPTSGFYLRRARVGLAGWMGPMFYFDVGGDFAPTVDPAAPGGAAATDAYVTFAPLLDDLVLVQAGQFDVPFTLENRTAEPYLPFIARSLPVRTLGAPHNKDIGVMVHGADDARSVYYSAGLFNGDGPGRRNADNQVDFIGRVVVSPLARLSGDVLRGLAFGGSGWYGQHLAGTQLQTQTTPGGFVVFDPTWTTGQGTPMPFALHERGKVLALAGELSIPIAHLFGLRGEVVWKKQDLAEDQLNPDGSTLMPGGRASFQGIGGYGEVWAWLLGDDRQLPAPGLQLPRRLGRVGGSTGDHGVMVTARGEFVKEDLTSNQTTLGNPNLATTRAVAATAAVNYWYGRRVRASANYGLTILSGTSERVKSLVAAGKYEHELLFLLGMSL
jgi:hypothetical protein